MCVIVYSKGKKEKEENIKRMWEGNPHGIGFAYKEENKIRVRKGFMELEEFISFYETFPEGIQHTIHFRLASTGEVSPLFTHPFPIDKVQIPPQISFSSRAVLFHNGNIDYFPFLLHLLPHLSNEQRKKLLSLSFSDTYILSLYIAIFQVTEILKHLKSKFLIFTSQTSKIYGFWEKEEEFYYSNLSWKPKKYFFSWNFRSEILQGEKDKKKCD